MEKAQLLDLDAFVGFVYGLGLMHILHTFF